MSLALFFTLCRIFTLTWIDIGLRLISVSKEAITRLDRRKCGSICPVGFLSNWRIFPKMMMLFIKMSIEVSKIATAINFKKKTDSNFQVLLRQALKNNNPWDFWHWLRKKKMEAMYMYLLGPYSSWNLWLVRKSLSIQSTPKKSKFFFHPIQNGS